MAPFPGTQLGRKTRPWCILSAVFIILVKMLTFLCAYNNVRSALNFKIIPLDQAICEFETPALGARNISHY